MSAYLLAALGGLVLWLVATTLTWRRDRVRPFRGGERRLWAAIAAWLWLWLLAIPAGGLLVAGLDAVTHLGLLINAALVGIAISTVWLLLEYGPVPTRGLIRDYERFRVARARPMGPPTAG